MKSLLVAILTLLMAQQTAALAINRRNAFVGIASSATAFAVSATAEAKDTKGAEAFVGTFSDPINHPGGKRTIRLLDSKVGDYQLAEVQGGGGIGEPKSYVLPAAVIGDRTIVIDFSPKGGPKDFVGVLDGGDIKFLKDGNRWPRLNE
jgi:hypothetical protein